MLPFSIFHNRFLCISIGRAWAVPGDRKKLKKIVALTSEEVFGAWSPTTLVDKTQKDTLAFMNKAIRMKSYRGELAHLTE